MSSSAERMRRLRERRRAEGLCTECQVTLPREESGPICAPCRRKLRNSVIQSKAIAVRPIVLSQLPDEACDDVDEDDDPGELSALEPKEREQVRRMLKNLPGMPAMTVERTPGVADGALTDWNPMREPGPRG